MMAVTIGPGPDRLVRRAEVRDMLKAYIYQAIGAAMAESWCEEVNTTIRKEAGGKRTFYKTPVFRRDMETFRLRFRQTLREYLICQRLSGYRFQTVF
jgi:Vitamin B12 dependent methionine synthase, activation domain.